MKSMGEEEMDYSISESFGKPLEIRQLKEHKFRCWRGDIPTPNISLISESESCSRLSLDVSFCKMGLTITISQKSK